jgi:hypothetical protein
MEEEIDGGGGLRHHTIRVPGSILFRYPPPFFLFGEIQFSSFPFRLVVRIFLFFVWERTLVVRVQFSSFFSQFLVLFIISSDSWRRRAQRMVPSVTCVARDADYYLTYTILPDVPSMFTFTRYDKL